MQLTLGTVIVCLFVFVRPMRFVQSCLAATLYVVASLLVSQDNHVGTKLLGCAMLCGSVLWGAVLAGCVVSVRRGCCGTLSAPSGEPWLGLGHVVVVVVCV
ncbi:hypothetical protein GPECTOR_482g420 [Gonium pectorale]|uniref:Uncharacterized protein n=1 Tax=Gonium pectorale TaxID=33097 RepID=A0A150FW35_GONPE|nr:hypothetical protein GPECTOR_482g420 [Gonium pectorale]|eukprot:KXZ41415.1 hypothetical protein GPECTOR_482g420 [Gonium pectorale]